MGQPSKGRVGFIHKALRMRINYLYAIRGYGCMRVPPWLRLGASPAFFRIKKLMRAEMTFPICEQSYPYQLSLCACKVYPDSDIHTSHKFLEIFTLKYFAVFCVWLLHGGWCFDYPYLFCCTCGYIPPLYMHVTCTVHAWWLKISLYYALKRQGMSWSGGQW